MIEIKSSVRLSDHSHCVLFFFTHTLFLVLMTDPAVAYTPRETGADGYLPYTRGTALDVWLKATSNSSGSVGEGGVSLGLVWPGVTVYPGMYSCASLATRPFLS